MCDKAKSTNAEAWLLNIEVGRKQNNKVWPNNPIWKDEFGHTVLLLKSDLEVQQTGLRFVEQLGQTWATKRDQILYF